MGEVAVERESAPGDGRSLSVRVHADDPISREGVRVQLELHEGVRVIPDGESNGAAVAILVVDRLDAACIRSLRRRRLHGTERVLLVASEIDDAGLMAAVEAGVGGVVWRHQATAEELGQAARMIADGQAALPPDVVARLLTAVGRLQQHVLVPQGLTSSGLSDREIEVLRLVAEGADTAEIAVRLSYSERTIKGILHDIKTRLHLRNRTHAVTYAMREGLL
jgi:DNA-binding NarL/FixJ family response regulator